MLLFLEILGVAQFSHRPTSPHLPLIIKILQSHSPRYEDVQMIFTRFY